MDNIKCNTIIYRGNPQISNYTKEELIKLCKDKCYDLNLYTKMLTDSIDENTGYPLYDYLPNYILDMMDIVMQLYKVVDGYNYLIEQEENREVI